MYKINLTDEERALQNSYARKMYSKEFNLITDVERAANSKRSQTGRRNINQNLRCISQWRSGANKRGIEWTISKEYLLALMSNTFVCPVLNLPLDYNCVGRGRGNPNPAKASLDRIDSSKGYEEGNVWIISWRANQIKNDATLDELEKLVLALRKKQGDDNEFFS